MIKHNVMALYLLLVIMILGISLSFADPSPCIESIETTEMTSAPAIQPGYYFCRLSGDTIKNIYIHFTQPISSATAYINTQGEIGFHNPDDIDTIITKNTGSDCVVTINTTHYGDAVNTTINDFSIPTTGIYELKGSFDDIPNVLNDDPVDDVLLLRLIVWDYSSTTTVYDPITPGDIVDENNNVITEYCEEFTQTIPSIKNWLASKKIKGTEGSDLDLVTISYCTSTVDPFSYPCADLAYYQATTYVEQWDSMTVKFPPTDFSISSPGTYNVVCQWDDKPDLADDDSEGKTLVLNFWARSTTYECGPAIVPGDILSGLYSDETINGETICREFTHAGDITDYLGGISLTGGSDIDYQIIHTYDCQCNSIGTQTQVQDNCIAVWQSYSVITPGTYRVYAVWSDTGNPVYANDVPATKSIIVNLYTYTTTAGTADPSWEPAIDTAASEKTYRIAAWSTNGNHQEEILNKLQEAGVNIGLGRDIDTAWICPSTNACDLEPIPVLVSDSIALVLSDTGGLDPSTPGYYHLTWSWYDVGLKPYNSLDGTSTLSIWVQIYSNYCVINQSLPQGMAKMVSGEFAHTENLLSVPSHGGSISLSYLHISYPESSKSKYGPFGYGTQWEGFESLSEDSSLSASFITMHYGNGGTLSYISTSTNLYLPPSTYTNKIIKNADGTYTKEGKNGNVTHYLSNGYFDYSAYQGSTTQYYYDTYSKITGITDPSGRNAGLYYDNYGRVTTIANGGGRKTYFSYSASSDLFQITNSMGYTKEFYYDGYHRMTTVRNYDGVKTQIFYGTNGKVTAHSIVAGNQSQNWQYSVNTNEQKVIITDPLGRQSNKYYLSSDYSSPTTISISGFTTIRYRNVLGQTTASRNERGLITYYQYDNDNNLVWQINPASQTTFYYYDSLGNQTSVHDILGNVNYYFYDTTLSQITAIRDSLGNTSYLYYDEFGQNTASQNARGTMHYTYYDEYGQVTATQGPSGCSSCDGSISYFDSYGNKTASMDAMEYKHYTEYDSLNRMVKTMDHYKGQTLFSYDSADNLNSVTDAKGNTLWYYYDSFSRMTAQKNALNQYSYSFYDGYGRITAQQDLKGQKSYYYYDGLSRVTSSFYQTDNQVISRWYDSYDQLTAVNDPVKGMTYYYYDLYGQLTTVACTSSGWGTVQYAYDAYGRMTSLTNPAGNQFVYQYDNYSRLNWITNWVNQTTFYYYDNYGSLTSLSYPNNTQTYYYFDAIGKLTTLLILKNNSSILEQMNYEYDADGNQTRMVDYASNTTRYYYDALHRLTWEYRLGTHAYDYQYSYDSVGNRMTKISNGTETTYYAYNELNQLTSSTVGSQTTHYLYDTNGNMTYDDRGITIYPKQFTWNQKNQLTQFTYTGSPQVFKYQYDVEGRKVFYNQNFSGGKQYRYLYEGNRVLQENEPHPMSGWNLGGRPVAVYTLAPGEVGNIISVRRSTTDYFYHYDGMGNVLFLTDTAGNKAAEYLLDSYGNIAYSQGASVNSYLWRTLPYDSSIESYQQTGSIYSSKNNKLLNAGYHQQQSEEYIDESKVDFSCGYCDYQDEDEFKNAKEWYKKLLILSVGNYSEDAWKKFSKIPGKPIARTDCNCSDKTVTLSEAVTRWYKNGVWDSKGSCCNYVAKIHEEVHQQQCIDLGWFSYNFYRFSPFIWTLEKPAYKKTVDELKSILDIMKMIRGL
jgi:YD repeat-containing protein